MIHIGNQTSFAAASATEPFDYALANGFDAFEWFPDKKPDTGWDGADLDEAARRDIRQKAMGRGMSLAVHARWQANPLQPESFPLLLTDLELASDLGAILLNIHLQNERGIPEFVEAITPLIRAAAEAGLELAIENTPLHAPELFNELFQTLARLDSAPTRHVGMCLDIGHANLCAATRNRYLDFVDRLAPEVPIVHLHLHENWGDADTHLPLFTGPSARDDSGIKELITRLRRRSFGGSIILEQWPRPQTLLNQARERLLQMLGQPDIARPKPRRHTARRIVPESTSAIPSRKIAAPNIPANPDTTQPAEDGFVIALAEVNSLCRSWREKLDAVRGLLAEGPTPLTETQLVDITVFLRFLSTGQIHCEEDGRHFRPGHHARIARQIQERLAEIHDPSLRFLVRRIHPWLPSSGEAFQSAEPLTRIRDLAHRNDIPAALKREIKGTLQNKLHRCAGPGDLVTSAALLARIADPESALPRDFVNQFTLFHEELKEFFNARSLEERLEALVSKASGRESDLIGAFLQHKVAQADPMAVLKALTALRTELQAVSLPQDSADPQDRLLADLALEDFAFVTLSNLIGARTDLAPLPGGPVSEAWQSWLETLCLGVQNLAGSAIEPDECLVIQSELNAWSKDLNGRDERLRLKATIERTRRVAEHHCDRILRLFPPRVEKLGRALGLSAPLIKVFAESEIRSHVVFQVAKLASAFLRTLRESLNLPAWDVIVCGETAGRIKALDHLELSPDDFSEPVILLLNRVAGDEPVPAGVQAVILAESLPHLSHFAVRAREAGVVLLCCEEPESFRDLKALAGQRLRLVALPDRVEWEPTETPPRERARSVSSPAGSVANRVPQARLSADPALVPLEVARIETCGSKAAGARCLQELGREGSSRFKTPRGLVIPFGVMEAALGAQPELQAEYLQLSRAANRASSDEFAATVHRLRCLVQQVAVPDEILFNLASIFQPDERLMVRSSANVEDSQAFAGAGLFESVANVAPSEVAAAVRTVWTSLWTPRAALTRRQAGISHEQVHMAVLIQQMINPDLAFVLHTVNPLTENPNEVCAEVVVGLGEALASGTVQGSPYRLIYDKSSGKLRTDAFANFSFALRVAPTGGLRPDRVDYSRERLSLDLAAREQLGARLANIARVVEAKFGSPQDIEGVLVGDEIYLVQARPQPGLKHSLPRADS